MLRRAIDYFVMPLGLSLELAIAALLIAWFCRKQSRPIGRRIAMTLGIISVSVLYLSSIRITADALTAWVEREYPPIPMDRMEAVDAVMVLGGGTEVARRRDGTAYLENGPRFEAAMELLQAGRARMLVLSGAGSQVPGDPISEGEQLRERAIARGIEPSRIVITPLVRTTGDEARELAALARAHGWVKVAIATDSGHLGRAIPLARSHGLDAVPFATNRQPPLPAQPAPLRWLPTAQGLHRTTRAWHEILGRFAD